MGGFDDFLKSESKKVNKPYKKKEHRKKTPIEDVQGKLKDIFKKSKYMDLGGRYK